MSSLESSDTCSVDSMEDFEPTHAPRCSPPPPLELTMCTPRTTDPSPAEWRQRQENMLAQMIQALHAAPRRYEAKATPRVPSASAAPQRSAQQRRREPPPPRAPALNPLLAEREEVPPAPTGVSASIDASRPFGPHVAIRWQESTSSRSPPATAFDLEWEDASLGIWSSVARGITGEVRSWNLDSGSDAARRGRRRFRARACNRVGWGRWSTPSPILRIGVKSRRPKTSSTSRSGSSRPSTAYSTYSTRSAASSGSAGGSTVRRDRWGGVKSDPKTAAAAAARDRVKEYEARVLAAKKAALRSAARNPPAPVAEWGGGALRHQRPAPKPTARRDKVKAMPPPRSGFEEPSPLKPLRVLRPPPLRPSRTPTQQTRSEAGFGSPRVRNAATLSAMKRRENELMMSLARIDGELLQTRQ